MCFASSVLQIKCIDRARNLPTYDSPTPLPARQYFFAFPGHKARLHYPPLSSLIILSLGK